MWRSIGRVTVPDADGPPRFEAAINAGGEVAGKARRITAQFRAQSRISSADSRNHWYFFRRRVTKTAELQWDTSRFLAESAQVSD